MGQQNLWTGSFEDLYSPKLYKYRSSVRNSQRTYFVSIRKISRLIAFRKNVAAYRKIRTKYIPTYIQMYVRIYEDIRTYTYLHTYVNGYLRTYTHTFMHTHAHRYVYTFIHTYIQTYIHTYIHMYGRMYIHTYSSVPRGGLGVQTPPKFQSFDKAAFDCKLSGKCLVFLFQHPN